MADLQTEVLEMEFHEFSKGMRHITEEEFAKVLLRYTILSEDETEEYLTRLRERIPQVEVQLREGFEGWVAPPPMYTQYAS